MRGRLPLWPSGRGRLRAALGDKPPIEIPGFCLWLDTKLSAEKLDARFVLPQGGAPAAALRIEAHERPVRRLVEGLERQQAHGEVDSGVDDFLSHMLREELPQGLHRAGAELFTLDVQPGFEGLFVNGEAFEQITVIEAHRFLERGSVPLAGETLEARHIHDDLGWLETDHIALSADRLDLPFRKGAAEIEQALP